MVPPSPSLIVAAAGALIGAGVEPGASRGRLLDIMLARVGARDSDRGPWSAAFVHHVGYWAHYDFRGRSSSWPLPMTDDPRALEEFARERGICAEVPVSGDVFLHWSPAQKRRTRMGLIVNVGDRLIYPATGRPYHVCTTIEGETSDHGAPEGLGIHVVRRNLSAAAGDRFIRWTSLDPREPLVVPAGATQDGARAEPADMRRAA
jgi:hypothetical protein